MAYLRFHRRLKLLPGVRLNLAKTGPSLGLGTNGAMLNVGPMGIRTTVGIPGSGLSVISRRSWQATGNTVAAPSSVSRRHGALLPLALGGIALTLAGIAIGATVLVIAGVVVAFVSLYAIVMSSP
jgi:hypothetical protein